MIIFDHIWNPKPCSSFNSFREDSSAQRQAWVRSVAGGGIGHKCLTRSAVGCRLVQGRRTVLNTLIEQCSKLWLQPGFGESIGDFLQLCCYHHHWNSIEWDSSQKKRKQVVYCVPKKILAHPIGWFLLFTCLLTTCTSVSRFEGHGTIVSVLLLKMSMVIVLKDQYLSCWC